VAKIAVVTDSTATIPEEIRAKYDIHVAPLSITWDRVKYRDGIDISAADFYKRLRTAKDLPTTSGAIQGEFLQIFEALKGKVDGAVTITLSSALSAAYSSAMTAREMVPELKIEVVDSRLAATALGFVAIEAAKAAAAGAAMEKIVSVAQGMVPKVHSFLGLDTLEYLKRGGRATVAEAEQASFLQVKPIMIFKDGLIQGFDKPRTREKMMERLVEIIQERVTSTPLHLAVMHGDFPAGAETLKKMILEKFKPVEILTTEITPVVGTHFGPDALAIAFYNE
jgi:DegV family protein with EDD domain